MKSLLTASARMTISNNDISTRDPAPFPLSAEFCTVCALTRGVTVGGVAPASGQRRLGLPPPIVSPCDCVFIKFVAESVLSAVSPASVVVLSSMSLFFSFLVIVSCILPQIGCCAAVVRSMHVPGCQ